jgi:DNA polymerase I-like protein with 3'-5' exonuclease and polymerase domains
MALYGIDVETACAVDGCPGNGCDHALDINKSRITCVAVADEHGLDEHVFRNRESYNAWYLAKKREYTAHTGKFDYKQLVAHGWQFELTDWQHDCGLMAFNYHEQIPDSYIDAYNEERKVRNKDRTGKLHRTGGRFGLKTLAPYFLSVPAFWEPEEGYDDDAYVMKDARYALQLTRHFLDNWPDKYTKAFNFYIFSHLPWTKNLALTELRGIKLNIPIVEQTWAETEQELIRIDGVIQEQWANEFKQWQVLQEFEVSEEYASKRAAELAKPKPSLKRIDRLYLNEANALKHIKPFNLNSPTQLKWLLKDQLALDIVNMDGDESTDKEMLQNLSVSTPALQVLLEHRKAKKLCTTYFPEYLHWQHNGRIHTTFNTIGARTGRLSASLPNLQQVPASLHEAFEADAGCSIVTRDLSAIEPTILAYYSEDPILCELLLKGGDFHSTNAHFMFKLECDVKDVKALYPTERKVAKECGLAILYGAGVNRIYRVLRKYGLTQFTVTDAKILVKRLRELYQGVWKFKQELDSELEQGNTLYNLLGRPIKILTAQDVYMKGLNMLIQSSASDLLQDAAYVLQSKYELPVLLLVHDEILVQAPAHKVPAVIELMEEVLTKHHKLETKFGYIPIKIEGKDGKYWNK